MGLKKTEVTRYKAQLEGLRFQLTKLLQGSAEQVKSPGDSGGYSQHQADQGTDDFDRTISLEVSGKELDLLWQVERALEKIEEGTYGVCDVTGEDIPAARLKAVPYATMTVQAQEQHEKGLI